MNSIVKRILLISLFLFSYNAKSQQDSLILPEGEQLDIQLLVAEALEHNPDIHIADLTWDMMSAKIQQTSSLDQPTLRYSYMEIPGFSFGDAMYSRVELMQMFPYPGKKNLQTELIRMESEHGHHDHLEKINEVIAKLKSMYIELWFIQQQMALNRENVRLMKQVHSSVQTKFGVGQTSMQDVLKVQVEISKLGNEQISLRQKELSAKAMLMSLLNRQPTDTLGFAVISEDVIFSASLDSVLETAVRYRPMLKHDSLGLHEGATMLAMAKKEYYPDFSVGLEYVHSPFTGFNGWSVSAGITLPFAPWITGKTEAKVEEAAINIDKANMSLTSSRNMVFSTIKDLYYKADAGKKQLDVYRTTLLPQLRQSLDASLTAYQNGKTDFLMLLDSYRMLVDMTMEYYMTRMNFEQTLAELDREAGYQNVAYLGNK